VRVFVTVSVAVAVDVAVEVTVPVVVTVAVPTSSPVIVKEVGVSCPPTAAPVHELDSPPRPKSSMTPGLRTIDALLRVRDTSMKA
jgi:hypothetical protein